MERRDLIKDQIEQMAKILGMILSDFLGLKSTGDIEEAIQTTNERFQGELDLDIEKILALDIDELSTYLTSKELHASYLEILATYLTEIGISKLDEAEKVNYLNKAITLLDLADAMSKTFSFQRMNQRERIQDLLNKGR
jgi:hypothetical protein